MKSYNKVKAKKMIKNQFLISCISILLIMLILIGGSFAIFFKEIKSDKYNIVQVGDLKVKYTDLNTEGEVLQINHDYPVSDSKGSTGDAYTFSVENVGTLNAKYVVKIINDADTIAQEGCGENLLDPIYLRYKFDNNQILTLQEQINDESEYIIYTSVLKPLETKIHEIRLWLNETSPNSVLGQHFHGKVVIDIEQADDSDPYERPSKVFQNLSSDCTTYDDGENTFLTGKCSNNYVSYSGKLWRIVSKNNSTGTLKLVTNDSITASSYNSDGSTTFEGSALNQWLNEDFITTLNGYEKYLVNNARWDYTTATTPTKPAGTTTFAATVGLLNAYEYYTTYTNSSSLATSTTGYLNNGTNWWLLTPYNTTKVHNVTTTGALSNTASSSELGIRPAIVLKQSVELYEGDGSKINPYKIIYIDNSGANYPELTSGMIAVKYDEANQKWLKADLSSEWYDYNKQNWANAVTVTKETRATYNTAEPGTEILMDDINTMWVWIPRYEYQYTDLSTTYAGGTKALPGEIKINFLTDKDIYLTDEKVYKIPDGFTFGEEKLTGFWMAKFETSSPSDSLCATTESAANCNITTMTPYIIPNTASWRYITVSTAFDVTKLMQTTYAPTYGFNNTDNNLDIHLTKNTEWGIVAMLSQSKYGKYGNGNYTGANKEVYENKSSTYITGMSNGAPGSTTTNTQVTYDTLDTGVGASTTGTIYGVYDMAGGAWDYVMGNYAATIASDGFTALPDAKYYDNYTSTTIADTYKSGDAIYETSAWYSDSATFITSSSSNRWMLRGATIGTGTGAGVYAYGRSTGTSNVAWGFRISLKP